MKKIIVISILTASFVWGCNYINKDAELQSQIDTNQITSIKQSPDVESQRKLYLNLNQYEKSFIWKDRIQTYIDNNVLSSEQVKHLNDLLNMVNPKLFDSESPSKVRLIEQQWTPKALTLFQKEELRGLLGGLNKEVVQNKKTIKTNNLRAMASGCGCNGNSMFDCRGCNAQDACQGSGSGCGFMWAYSCEKSCYIPPVNED